jgi:hypothetical protein
MAKLPVVLLWISAVVFALIGLYFLAAPERAAASIGIAMKNATAQTDVRATYGGMVLGIAAFFSWAALSPARLEAGVWSMVLIYGGLALGRIVAIADGQRPGAMMWTFLAIELGFAITSAMLLRHLADSGPQEELP